MGQTVSLDEVTRFRAELQARRQRLVLTNGCFDLLHRGHVVYLQEARTLGDALVVGLNSDASVRAFKGPGRPLVPQEDRALILAALACVDRVVIFDEPTAEHLAATLKPDVYVKGGDYAGGHEATRKPLPEAGVVRTYGGEVVILPYLPGYSTTAFIDRILTRYTTPGGRET